MALQIWLPLNGNTNNYGLLKTTITNGGATINNNGKIGKCYQVDGTHPITFPSKPWMSMQSSYKFSLFMWVKGTSNSWLIAASGWELLIRPTFIRIGLSGNGQYPATYSGTFDANTWYHLGFTWDCDDGKLILYLNGEEKASSIVPSSVAYDVNPIIRLIYAGNSTVHYINDFRIYDNALSAKEVKELSKGLVLHYKLDNLYSNSNLVTSLVGGGQTTISGNTANITGNNSDTYFYIKLSNAMTSGKTYKISCVGNFASGIYYYFPIAGQTNISPGIFKIQNGYCEMIFVANDTCQNTGTQVILDDSGRNPGVGSITNVKLEELSTIYDCSGYGNNGSFVGPLSITQDSPRYNNSYVFSATVSNYITIPYQGLNGPYNNKELTFCFWINTQQQGNRHMIFGIVNSYNINIELSISNTLRVYWAGTPDWSPGITCTLNTWTHIGIVVSSTYIKCYKNGVLIGTNTTTPNWAGCTQNLMIGSDQRIGTYFLGAKLSDFRIYSTLLSDADIKELYDTAGSIDNKRNMLSFEFDEVEINKPEIFKTGITKINSFICINDKIKVLSDGSVFLQILHHNAPASNLFDSTNCWLNNTTNLYSATISLKTIFKNLSIYEFLVCEKLESSGSESQIRWTQTSNPALSSTLSGYTLISGSTSSSGGLVNKGTYGCFHNGNVWWNCCGSYTPYNGGIPGFKGIVKSGYLDLYIRIPQEMLKGNIETYVKFFQKSILAKQFIEK